jgi:predicted HicB family RNase H-like nuclease
MKDGEKQIHARVTIDVYKELKIQATKQEVTLNTLLNNMINDYLDKKEKEEK